MAQRCFTVFFAFVLTSSLAAQPKTVEVRGLVLDSGGRPIAGVQVSLIASSKIAPIETDRTNEKGEYQIKKVAIAPYQIHYTHTKRDKVVVPLLAEDKDQVICINMYTKGEVRSASALLDGLQSAEYELFHYLTLNEGEREEASVSFRNSSAEFLDGFEKLLTGGKIGAMKHIDMFLRKKHKMISETAAEHKLIVLQK